MTCFVAMIALDACLVAVFLCMLVVVGYVSWAFRVVIYHRISLLFYVYVTLLLELVQLKCMEAKDCYFVTFASAFTSNSKLLANASCKKVCSRVKMIYDWIVDLFYAPDLGGHFWAFVLVDLRCFVVFPIEPRKGGATDILRDLSQN